MDLSILLPILAGVTVFIVTFFLKFRGGNKDAKTTASPSTTAKSPKDVKSPAAANEQAHQKPIYGPVHIYFASQTGTAQNYSKMLGEDAAKNGFEPVIVDLVDFTPEFFKDVKLAIFAIATQGEGEPTDNSKTFHSYITDAARTGTEFQGLKFTVFALGNKQYQYYCHMGRKTDEFVGKLGAERVYKLGEGDDNESLEDDFNLWKTDLWTSLAKVAQASQPAATTETTTTKAKAAGSPFVLTVTSDLKEIDLENYDVTQDTKEYEFQAKQYLASQSAPITLIRELRQKTEDGSTLHVEIDCASVGLSYKTAQNLGIYAENAPETVNKAAELLGLNLKDVFVIEQNPEVEARGKFKHPIPSPISVETYLTKFCDLQGALRKKQLKDLAPFCQNEDSQKKLLFLASNEGKTEYDIQIQSPMKGLIDLIEEYGLKLTLENLIQISNVIMPRLYTIASSNKKHANTVHLCVSLHNDVLPGGNNKMGLVSGYLVREQQKSTQGKAFGKAKINIRDSTFTLPSDANVPVIMVGPGAGIAPFKGFIDEKAHLAATGEENPYGEMTLYFGCRGKEWDNLYREEFAQYHAEGIVKNFHIAFSREQGQKVYVQDLIGKNKDETAKLLFESNANLYICGSMAMGKSIIGKLGEIASGYFNIDAKEGQDKIAELEKNKRIIKELWG